jgi:hypothetical protein
MRFHRFLFFLIAISLGIVCKGQIKAETALHERTLRGKVKSMKQVSYNAVKKSGEIQKGKIYPDFENSFFVFNEEGYKTERQNMNTSGTVVYKVEYRYDKNWNVVLEKGTSYDRKSAETHAFSHTYDAQGREKEWIFYASDSSISHRQTFTYDSYTGNLIATGDYFNGHLLRGDSLHYDNTNMLTGKTSWWPSFTKGYKLIYSYDKNGNETERQVFKPKGKFYYAFLSEYDDKGNKTAQKFRKSSGKVLDMYTYSYEFDANNNWIKQITWEKGKPCIITEREITYFK